MSGEKTLTIYHTSDIHGRTGFGEKLASLVEPGALLVDCGDALDGSSTLYLPREAVIADLIRAGYRCQAVGNREFHFLHRCFLARARPLPFPLICSNLIDRRGRLPPFLRSVCIALGGLRIRVLGLVPPQYRTSSGWERIFGWRFLSADAALDELLNGVAAQDVDATILLSHLGLHEDRRLAARFPRLDAILGGHTHETLPVPEVVAATPIAHCGPYARYAGRLQLSLGNGKAKPASYALLPLQQERLQRGSPAADYP